MPLWPLPLWFWPRFGPDPLALGPCLFSSLALAWSFWDCGLCIFDFMVLPCLWLGPLDPPWLLSLCVPFQPFLLQAPCLSLKVYLWLAFVGLSCAFSWTFSLFVHVTACFSSSETCNSALPAQAYLRTGGRRPEAEAGGRKPRPEGGGRRPTAGGRRLKDKARSWRPTSQLEVIGAVALPWRSAGCYCGHALSRLLSCTRSSVCIRHGVARAAA